MPESALSAAETQQLLLRERDGTLPPEAAADMAALRQQNLLPPPIPRPLGLSEDVAAIAGPTAADVLQLAQPVNRYIRTEAPKTPLPVIGSVVGGLAGGLVTSPTVGGVPAGVLIGEGLGSAGGEYLNQKLGITEPSNAQIVWAGFAPLMGRVIGGTVKAGGAWALRHLPGASGAMQEIGAETAKGIPAIIAPAGKTADQLYDSVARFNPGIPTPNLTDAINTLRAGEEQVAQGLQSSEIQGITKGLEKIATQGEVPFQAVRANLRRLGARIAATRTEGGEVHGAYKFLYQALQSDLEDAASSSTVAAGARSALKVANEAARREFAANDLAEFIANQGLTSIQSGDSIILKVNPAKIANYLRKSPYLTDSLSPGELAKIDTTLRQLAKIPAAPPPRGVNVGSALTLGRAGAGAAIGAMVGIPPVITGGLSAFAPQIIGRAMVSDAGRAALMRSLQASGGFLDHQALATLAAVVRSLSANAPETGKEVDVGTPASARGEGP